MSGVLVSPWDCSARVSTMLRLSIVRKTEKKPRVKTTAHANTRPVGTGPTSLRVAAGITRSTFVTMFVYGSTPSGGRGTGRINREGKVADIWMVLVAIRTSSLERSGAPVLGLGS